VYWTTSAWQAVTQSTIRNTFQAAGFIFPNDTTANVADTDDTSNDAILNGDASKALNDLANLLVHVKIGGQSITASQFIEVDDEVPAFNEWDDADTGSSVITIDGDLHNEEIKDHEEDDEMPTETPPKLVEAMEMVRRLHLLANTQHPHLHSLVSQLDSQLTQLFIDSKGAKQTMIEHFFRKID
jgi:hypothetical protein